MRSRLRAIKNRKSEYATLLGFAKVALQMARNNETAEDRRG
jgi:hypothetical protein